MRNTPKFTHLTPILLNMGCLYLMYKATEHTSDMGSEKGNALLLSLFVKSLKIGQKLCLKLNREDVFLMYKASNGRLTAGKPFCNSLSGIQVPEEAGMETYLTVKDVALLFQLSVQTIRRYTMNREIPFHKINRAVRYDKNEINAWMESRRVGAAAARNKNLEGAQECARTGEGVDETDVTRRAPRKCFTGRNDEGAAQECAT